MNIVVTGSLGNISKPLTETLVGQGHAVTGISHSAERQLDIEALGAKAAIGSLQDSDFLTATFAGADAMYCMVPPNFAAPTFGRITAKSAIATRRQSGSRVCSEWFT